MFGGVTTPVSSEGLSIHGSNEAWVVGSSLFEVPVFNECQPNSLEQWGRPFSFPSSDIHPLQPTRPMGSPGPMGPLDPSLTGVFHTDPEIRESVG
jgi:hypothetical protein